MKVIIQTPDNFQGEYQVEFPFTPCTQRQALERREAEIKRIVREMVHEIELSHATRHGYQAFVQFRARKQPADIPEYKYQEFIETLRAKGNRQAMGNPNQPIFKSENTEHETNRHSF